MGEFEVTRKSMGRQSYKNPSKIVNSYAVRNQVNGGILTNKSDDETVYSTAKTVESGNNSRFVSEQERTNNA